MKNQGFVAVSLVAGIWVSGATNVVADWYDDFNDESYWQGGQDPEDDSNWFDRNGYVNREPDPKLWDIDNPHWQFGDWTFEEVVSSPV